MNTGRSNIIFVVIILISVKTVFPQEIMSVCKKDLINYVESMDKMDIPESHQTYFIHYETITHFKEENQKAEENIKIYMTGNEMVYESNAVTMYMDTSDAFIINHLDKTIYWTKGGINENYTQNKALMKSFQLSLIKDSQLTDCETLETEENNFRKSTLRLSEELEKQTNAESLECFYDTDENRLYKIRINYRADYPVISQTVIYRTIDFNYKNFKPLPARQRVFNSGNELRKKYAGYQLIKK